jgi:DNA-directed RNA polymerase subunit H (RpoH/RPB5)
MSSSNNRVLQIYNARKIILELLHMTSNYNIDDYKGFSINEIDVMLNSNQLDMLLSEGNPSKTYVKFHLGKNLNENSLQPIIEDLFILTDTLSTKDTLIVIYEGGDPNDSLKTHLKYKFSHDNIFVVVHNIKRLQFNLLQHHLIPSNITILTDSETTELMQKYHLNKLQELPEISRFDPMALAISLRPGNVCKFYRKSPTSLLAEYYRICI